MKLFKTNNTETAEFCQDQSAWVW